MRCRSRRGVVDASVPYGGYAICWQFACDLLWSGVRHCNNGGGTCVHPLALPRKTLGRASSPSRTIAARRLTPGPTRHVEAVTPLLMPLSVQGPWQWPPFSCALRWSAGRLGQAGRVGLVGRYPFTHMTLRKTAAAQKTKQKVQ